MTRKYSEIWLPRGLFMVLEACGEAAGLLLTSFTRRRYSHHIYKNLVASLLVSRRLPFAKQNSRPKSRCSSLRVARLVPVQ